MALKPATGVSLDVRYEYTVVQIEPKLDGIGRDAPQKHSPEGIPLWTVDALRQGDEAAALVSVTVPGSTQPDVAGPAQFSNLRSGVWLSRERAGQGGLFWQADTVKPAQARRGESA